MSMKRTERRGWRERIVRPCAGQMFTDVSYLGLVYGGGFPTVSGIVGRTSVARK